MVRCRVDIDHSNSRHCIKSIWCLRKDTNEFRKPLLSRIFTGKTLFANFSHKIVAH